KFFDDHSPERQLDRKLDRLPDCQSESLIKSYKAWKFSADVISPHSHRKKSKTALAVGRHGQCFIRIDVRNGHLNAGNHATAGILDMTAETRRCHALLTECGRAHK